MQQPDLQLALGCLKQTAHRVLGHGIWSGGILAFNNVAGGAKVDAARPAVQLPLLLPSRVCVLGPQRLAHTLQRRQAAHMCLCRRQGRGKSYAS